MAVGTLYMISELCVDNPLMTAILDGIKTSLPYAESSETSHTVKVEGSGSTNATSYRREGVQLKSVVDPLTQTNSNKKGENADDDSEEEYFADLDVGADGKPIVAETKVGINPLYLKLLTIHCAIRTYLKRSQNKNTGWDVMG